MASVVKYMKKKEIIGLIILALMFFYAGYKYYNKKYEFEDSALLMDTLVNIQLESQSKNADSIIDSAFAFISKQDSMLSYYKKNSIVYRMNHTDKIVINDVIYKMLEIGKNLYSQTDSLYDLTIGDLVDIWNFKKEKIPSADMIDSALVNVGFDKIKFNKKTIEKPRKMKLNFGSIAKGLIIDKTVEYLKKHKIKKGIINAGGDIRIFGYAKPIKVGIQHPRKKSGEIIGIIKVGNKAVVTSGDYERFFIKNGKRYHHILNPKTGFPATDAVSVTVISDSAVLADAYSTALFLMGYKNAIRLANKTSGIEAILFYEKEGKLFYKKSLGMDKYLLKISKDIRKE